MFIVGIPDKVNKPKSLKFLAYFVEFIINIRVTYTSKTKLTNLVKLLITFKLCSSI